MELKYLILIGVISTLGLIFIGLFIQAQIRLQRELRMKNHKDQPIPMESFTEVTQTESHYDDYHVYDTVKTYEISPSTE